MDVVLMPGLGADVAASGAVAAVLEQAGHHAHPLILPRTQSAQAERAGVTLLFRIDSLVMLIDAIGGPVAVVVRAGEGAVTDAVVGARPGQVIRIVSVSGQPVGEAIAATEPPAEEDDLTVLDWSADEAAGLEELLFAAIDEPPAASPSGSEREFGADQLGELVLPADDSPAPFPPTVEVDPGTTRPEDLGAAIVAALEN